MRITLDWLIAREACEEGKKWWKLQGMPHDPVVIIRKLQKSDMFPYMAMQWIFWLAAHILTERQQFYLAQKKCPVVNYHHTIFLPRNADLVIAMYKSRIKKRQRVPIVYHP